MGNHPSSGERRHKSNEHYGNTSRLEGQAINIDKHKGQKLIQQQSDEEHDKNLKSPQDSLNNDVIARNKHLLNSDIKKLPYVVKWTEGGKDVMVAGTFSNWQEIPMVKSESDFLAILNLPEGKHEYKFLVDGEWKVDPKEEKCENTMGTCNNVLTVNPSDFQELEDALLKDPNDKKGTPFHVSGTSHHKSEQPTKDDFTQEVPKINERGKGPPVLPQHLMQIILNKDTPVSCEPTLLPKPNHVMLNHLYALSIKDDVMVLSTTTRYRNKFVTTLVYRPIN